MSEPKLPVLAKWPFIVGDALLVLAAVWIANKSPNPFSLWPLLFTIASVAVGAGLCIAPFLLEYRAKLQLAESDGLNTAVEQIGQLQSLAEQIAMATGQWQSIQELSGQTVAATQKIAEKIGVEARAFTEFMNKANDAERNNLRLEVEKLRRGEGEWLQTIVRLLDHVHALYLAGARSGQANVREQLSTFQNACRDLVRRMGLVALDAQVGERFDEIRHQLVDGHPPLTEEALVAEIVANGFTFQGQLLRRVVVTASAPAGPAKPGPLEPGEAFPEQEDLLSWEEGTR